MQEAVTPTKDQEELSKWFNHAWDPNTSRRPQQPERATSDAENFVDVRPHKHFAMADCSTGGRVH